MYYLTTDLETTGLDITKDEPIQVAWLVTNSEGKVFHKAVHYVATQIGISPGAEKIHGITGKMLEEKGLPCSAIAEKYTKLVWDYQPLTILGYNILNFDFPMWQNFMARHKKGFFKHPPVIAVTDVMHIASYVLKTRKWPKLSDFANWLGILYDKDSLHDAMFDVKLTWDCYLKVKEKKI